MKKLNLVEVLLGKEKSWRPTAILLWLGFFIGVLIIFLLPEDLLLIFSTYSLTPTVANFVSCSKIKVHVAAFFNLMLMYSLIIALVMTMTVKIKSSDLQRAKRWAFPIILFSLFCVYIGLFQFVPSCLEMKPTSSSRKIDLMINSPFYLLTMGVLFVNGAGVLAGFSFLLIKNLKFIKE